MRFHAAGDVGEALAVPAAAGSAEAREVVLVGAYVTGIAQRACLEDHLEEGHVPADAELLAVAHVRGGEPVVAVAHARVARAQVRHEASRCGAGGDLIVCGNLDLGEIGRGCGTDGYDGKSDRRATLRKICA